MKLEKEIDSPFAYSKAVLKMRQASRTFRKEYFEITEHYYKCKKTGEEFTQDWIDELDTAQVKNQYRDKFGLPFPDQIRAIREKYKVSATKMSEILGLGVNSYRLYEQGEVPSVGNSRLILAADDSEEFSKFLRMSQEIIGEKDFKKISKRVDELVQEKQRNKLFSYSYKKLFNVIVPDEFTGYRLPDLSKISHMILFFSQKMDTWKTKLNKLLFYSDFLAFQQTGFSISGLAYRAIQMGPVPSQFEDMYNEIANLETIVQREYKAFDSGNFGSYFKPIVDFNHSIFTEIELEILEYVREKFRTTKVQNIIQKSHKELAWKENEKEKKRISYKSYGFQLNEF